MQKTKIEYLDYTWSPLAMLCTPTESPGCLNCWHRKFAKRHAGNPLFSRNDRAAWAGKGPPALRLDELEAPSKLKKPARIGVQFMGDLFHEKVSHKQLTRIFSAMSYDAPHHKYIVLTKRPERAKEYFDPWLNEDEKYLWLGVSVSNQADADRWIPTLLQIPAAKRFVSYEPALGPVDFTTIQHNNEFELNALTGDHGVIRPLQGRSKGLDLIIAGGESGPGARPSHPDWFRKVRDDCNAAGIPFYLKQLGEWMCFRPSAYGYYVAAAGDSWKWKKHWKMLTMFDERHPCPEWLNSPYDRDNLSLWGNVARVGKKAAGRELDGQIHDGWPGE